MIQDFWRSVLFRDGRARAAATNDACWLLAMAVTAPLAWSLHSAWSVIGCWGFGALAGTLLGFAQTRARPHWPRRALHWWRTELWPLGRWLGANSLGYSILSYSTLIVLVSLVGNVRRRRATSCHDCFCTADTRGSGPCASWSASALSCTIVSAEAAAKLAFRLGIASALVTTAYFAVLSLGGSSIVPGSSAIRFAGLPISSGRWESGKSSQHFRSVSVCC